MASGEASIHETTSPTNDDSSSDSSEGSDDLSIEVKDQMIKAAEKGDVNTLKNILEPNPNFVNAKFDYVYDRLGFDDCTLLHISACHGHVHVLKYLLSIDADIHAVDDVGGNILHFAGLGGKVEVIKYLLQKGLDINQVDNHGDTILHYAATNDRIEVMKYLVEKKGFDINQVDNVGDTPLHNAASEGKVKAVKFLTAHGADIYITNKDRETPLLRAVSDEEGSVVRYLINECKMDITQLDQRTQSEINRMLQEESSPENSSTEGDGDDKALSDAENGADDNEEEMQHYE